LYPAQHRLPGTYLIAPPEWLVAEPIELGSLMLQLDEGPQTVAVDGSEPESATTRPLRTAGERFERYTSAMEHLSPPALFESRPCYRLLDVSLAARRLEFGLAGYFDKLDVCEALAHELAAACLADGLPGAPGQLHGRLPFRELIGDPFTTRTRPLNSGFAALTIRRRRHPAGPSFLLHWRDPAKVATGGGSYSVIPEGEFQPASAARWDRRNDLDLWRNIVREYSEELLGAPEHDNTRTQPIGYEQWSLYQRLQAARADGLVRVHVLGLGLSALTLAPTILTAVVIDDDVFTELFDKAVRFNEEGEIVTLGGGAPTEGIPFTEASVRRMLDTEPMSDSGAACLALTWQHRHALGL
ncbi:MAG: XRE family transcriptional regulator, partial [Actinobacteria bacterium]|nr:XRE family transcriptional regulator [Actinomycetota bacterium]